MAILNKMTGFKVFKGTKEQFISSGKAVDYKDAIVFITGGSNAADSCIFAQGIYFANFTEFLATINYVKGIVVGDTTYNAAIGGGYVGFGASDPATLDVDVQNGKVTVGLKGDFVAKVNTTAENLGTAADEANDKGSVFARIANLAALVGELTGGETTSIAAQIDALRKEIKGTLAEDDAATLEAINDELDALAAKWAGLATEVSENAGTNVKVTVKTKDGVVSGVEVDESGLTGALNLKANAADVYTKGEADTMAQGKVDALANGAVKANTDAIATLNGNTSVPGSVDKKIQDAINAFAGSANSDNVIENVTELLAYVSKVDGSKDLSLAIADIAANKAAIEALNGAETAAGSVAKSVKDAIDAEVERAEAAYAVKGTEGVAAGAAERAEEAYTLAGQKATAAEAKAQAVAAIGEIAEVEEKDESKTVKVYVTTKAGSVSSVEVDDAGVKAYADQVAGTAKSEAIAATAKSLESYYNKAEVDAMWMWEEL